MRPAEGERAAVVGFSGQYGLAARIVRAKLPMLEWIRVADPAAGVADDFQFQAGPTWHALQVKWSQYPESFAWGTLVNPSGTEPALLKELAQAWTRLRESWTGPLVLHLCTNNYASTATPRGSTPLAEVTAAGPRHFAAFLARSFEPLRRSIAQGGLRWNDLAQLPEVKEWVAAWNAMRAAASLDDDQFVSFVRDFELSFALPADELLMRPGGSSADAELRTLAATLQELVADPAQPSHLDRGELLDRLGWSDRIRYRHPHRFPLPAVYTANESARATLEQRLAKLAGGYVALVGPAGSGKSTLLASLVVPGRVVRYYAFVPDAPDPLSGRGEADSFLHDLSLGLEDGGLYRSGYGNDLQAQRAVLLDQLDQAGQRWLNSGERTIIIVDGLDHIPREQNPTRSLLNELPAPNAIPNGVFVILGTQTTAVLHDSIEAALGREERTIDVPALASNEVRALADKAGPGTWLYPGQLSTLVEASEGHPLALTYLLQELTALESAEQELDARRQRADLVLADASEYGRHIEERYRGYLRVVGDDREVFDLLAAVARLRSPVSLDWLATWADPHALTTFASRTSVFFRRSENEWRFIHNSFRLFLSDETARVAGTIDPTRNRQLHSALADLCASAHDWPAYRDEELAQRFLAGEYTAVLKVATPTHLREALLEFRPLATVREHALLALRAAAAVDDHAAYVRLLIFHNELWQREQVLEPKELAAAVFELTPDRAAEHIVRGGQLRLSAADAMEQAVAFAEIGALNTARDIMHACGGLAGLVEKDRPVRQQNRPASVANWAQVIWSLSGVDRVMMELDHVLPHPSMTKPAADRQPEATVRSEEPWQRDQRIRDQRDRDAATTSCRNLAHARCFDLLMELGDDEALDALTTVIDAEAEADWRARARVVRALAAAEDGAPNQVLRWVREILEIDAASPDEEEDDEDEQPRPDAPGARRPVPLTLRLRAAEALTQVGLVDAPEIDALVPPGTIAAWPDSLAHRKGLSAFQGWISLHRLRVVHPDPTPTRSATDLQSRLSEERDVGNERFRHALRTLARLEGQHRAASVGRDETPVVAAHAGPIIRLLEVPQQQTRDWNGWYNVRDAAPDLMRRLVLVATRAGGATGLRQLLDLFDIAWTTPDRARFWSISLQQMVVMAVMQAHPSASSWAIRWLERLNREVDKRAFGLHDRVETWLRQARAWAGAGDASRGKHAMRAAVSSSLGPGYHEEDTQLTDWLDWLAAAVDAGKITPHELTMTARDYAARILNNFQETTGDAASAVERLTLLTFPVSPELACAMVESLCEAGVVDEASAIKAVVLAATRDSTVPAMLGVAIATNLLLPIVRVPSTAVTDTLRARDDSGEFDAILEHASRIWTVPDNRESSGSADEAEAIPAEASTPTGGQEPMRPTTARTLLTAMRAARTAGDLVAVPSGGWESAVERVASMSVSAPVARALLEEATRLELGSAAIGSLAALAARVGDTASAMTALTRTLARTRGTGWLTYIDGGSRLKLFKAALRDRNPELIGLAARDLAGSLTSGEIRGQIQPNDLHRIAELIGGSEVIAAAWPDVIAYLDKFAPTGGSSLGCGVVPATSAGEAVVRWAAGYLGHPVRPLDFGARRVLQVALRLSPDAAQRVLAEAIGLGGWAAEAALLAIVTAPPADRPPSLDEELAAAVDAAVVSSDAICRSIARRLAELYGMPMAVPPHRPLPAVYRLTLPPLLPRSAPELDAEGTPHLNLHDPQHLVAPFDIPVEWIAELAGLDLSAVMSRAAAIASANTEPWARGGHRAQADRLKRRGQKHTYRPWAYMAGRRALGFVLAELLDANMLGDSPRYPAYELGLVDERLLCIETHPVPVSTPVPWRSDGASNYDASGWCGEVGQAAQVYAKATADATPYVLAESSEWHGLEWGRPEEVRIVSTTHGQSIGTLILTPGQAWENTFASAMGYPDRMSLGWSGEELVLRGREPHSDPPYFDWLAMHPAAAARLGWLPNPDELFAWRGQDGGWRARTIRRARGQLSHQPPANTACAEVWQVVLSDIGRAELSRTFPGIARKIHVTRTLPANRRLRLVEETASAQASIQEPASVAKGQEAATSED
ncbi:ATP-binding protein [Actinomadura rudentiformis]|uniref:ATP-binding protein n=1 Tax=Actinomadura rudentiformis TaxID=359158 RepID=A0A6H9YTJ4_9ACTN|nr:ATP-binding protein [Actinomadura rudentiformis]KAB2351594.1 ATP-binding protein [Actinomadura rudentiformis]